MFENKNKIILLIILIILTVSAVFLLKGKLDYKPQEKLENQEISDKEIAERIGQMIMVGFRGTEISEKSDIVKVIKDVKIGGVILFDYDVPSKSFPRNILNPEQTKELVFDLQRYSLSPLFVAIDAEGKEVNRLKKEYGFSGDSSPEGISQELKDLGFNMNLAPVVDLNINPNNPIIGNRSFSSDPQEVFSYAQTFIEAHNKKGIITVAKHFPGHGSSSNDSHLGLVDITETYREEEIIPYKLLLEKDLLNAVMTAHIFNRDIDKNYPATLSSLFLKDILRDQIGFEGVIISDDMQMKAISDYYGFEDAIIKAINAGCDLLLFSNNASEFDERIAYKIKDIIFQAIKDGKISKERIIESSNRIYSLKHLL